ncbi:hypothetical protein AUQ39_07885 [Lacticaseibacillus casei]|uniref:Uncharacterized protein n=2 Tax=Lacticaseibacillus zeae TaxID=57037 RepID=A0A5R8LUQ9_LACZE|nr:hypothetical protein AUQ39_07885 [Lacticaseibacillus casei]QVI31888.1 hypothetical protein KG087_13630 [Lacticaseibacillus zeae]TLF40910.1 hypothetical protein FEI14_09650 [Lacticaseibacillus zeae]
MTMAKGKLQIDREKFAYAVVANYQPDEKTDLKASKAVLRRFLIAYYLADQFNTLESNHFDQDKGWDFSLLAKGLDQISLH